MRREYVAVIQAGGKGTRMRELTNDVIPKPMLRLNDKPMLQWQLENIKKYGIYEFIFIIGYLGRKVKEYFCEGSRFGVHIQYIEEEIPLGSAGALYYLKNMLYGRDFLLFFGDVMFDMDLRRMLSFHESNRGQATLLVHPNCHPHDSDLLIMDENNHIVEIEPKTKIRNYWYENCVNAGIYVLSKQIVQEITEPRNIDLETGILEPLMSRDQVFGYRTTEYVKDAGTVERFYKVSDEQKRGLWEKKNLENKQKCVFLDRDGTINQYCGLISKTEDFRLEDGAAEAIRLLNEAGYLAIVITNQPVVARGMCSIEDVRNIHRKMQVLLGEKGAYLDDIVFCPHHPDKGFPEENLQYKILCNCRKPEIGMIDKAVERYNIERSQSYMVGDSTVDVQTGKNAGLRTILLHTGQGGLDNKYIVEPDKRAENILKAVQMILDED